MKRRKMSILEELNKILMTENLQPLEPPIVEKDETWIQSSKKNVKPSKMHVLLGIPADKDISDKYSSGETLGTALARKLGGINDKAALTKAIKMLTYAGNTSGKAIFKTAKNCLIHKKEVIETKEKKAKSK